MSGKDKVEAQYEIYCTKLRECCISDETCQGEIKYYPSMDKTLLNKRGCS